MTRDEFERVYCERSKVSVDHNRLTRVALPCGCAEEGCDGWAMISLTDPGLLIAHLWMGLPGMEQLREMEKEQAEAFMRSRATHDSR